MVAICQDLNVLNQSSMEEVHWQAPDDPYGIIELG